MTDNVIPAATILLLRDEPAFQVLMIERHADIKFAGGALVFPGGRIDAGDSDPAWREHANGLETAPAEEHAPRIAAIREAFEETGLLLARRNGEEAFITDAQAQRHGPWRKRVEDDDREFLRLIREENLRLACDALTLYARWAPPASVTHRRYDTWFFVARAPAQEAREDGNEATEAVWIAPQEALRASAAKERKMIFPTLRNVELLNVSGSAGEAIEFAKKRKIAPIEPVAVKRGGAHYLTIPSDMGYPVTEEALETAMRS